MIEKIIALLLGAGLIPKKARRKMTSLARRARGHGFRSSFQVKGGTGDWGSDAQTSSKLSLWTVNANALTE
jgi:hypothetical protein